MAVIAVAAVLTVVAMALVALVRQQLFTNLDDSLGQRADTYQTTFAEEGEDELSILFNSNDEDRAAQLVGLDGHVIAWTPNLAGSAPVVASAELPSGQALNSGRSGSRGQTLRTTTVAGLEDDAYRVLSRLVATETGPAVLHLAQNVDDLNDTLCNLKVAFWFIVPVVSAVLAALVWWLVGRTLRPVELIRTEVADISGTDLRRRVPVPEQADEIARLAATMNQMLDRIDSAARRQRQFVADASHELRTPLTRIRTELEVDQNHPELADRSATNAAVLQEAIDLQALLDDLLFLAKSDEHQHQTDHQPIDLDDIVFLEVQNARADADVRFDTSAVSAAHLSGHPGQLRRAVGNLLTNAVRHADSLVTVTLGEVAGLDGRGIVRLTIADDGPGVPEAYRDRIFERFGRAGDARTRTDGGAGLGLAIVRDIVARHGGQVSYDDDREQGARFIIELPVRVP